MDPGDVIRDSELLRGLPADDVAVLAAVGKEFGYRHGEYLFRLGDAAYAISIIREGGVELTVPLRVLGVEKEVAIEELGPGDTVAWSALVEPRRLTMNARATVASRLLSFACDDLLALFASRPDIGCRFLFNLTGVIGRRFRQTKALWIRELQHNVSERYG